MYSRYYPFSVLGLHSFDGFSSTNGLYWCKDPFCFYYLCQSANMYFDYGSYWRYRNQMNNYDFNQNNRPEMESSEDNIYRENGRNEDFNNKTEDPKIEEDLYVPPETSTNDEYYQQTESTTNKIQEEHQNGDYIGYENDEMHHYPTERENREEEADSIESLYSTDKLESREQVFGAKIKRRLLREDKSGKRAYQK
ncbi:hypothetical protein MHBO_000665 [Bonamia ostreae]|uniref:Uncharacterized protein n=1 Tax=Bonamia ostreae TaxID=126728 RepID=A0ABV2AGD5_9EUKA